MIGDDDRAAHCLGLDDRLTRSLWHSRGRDDNGGELVSGRGIAGRTGHPHDIV